MMKSVVINTILDFYEKGYDELGPTFLITCKPEIANCINNNLITVSYYVLKGELEKLSEYELITIFESQCCQKYR